jgi:D-alanyl-D-alanine carboxypeptidase (penicillin-binding protein 5/6)
MISRVTGAAAPPHVIATQDRNMLPSLRRFARFSAAFAILAGPLAAMAQTPEYRVPTSEPKTTSIVMDANTGEILFSERADSPRYPASVTKVMTFYLAFEALAAGRLHLDDQVVVSPLAAAQPPTKLGLRAGETISVRDALNGMAVHSANDMAVAIAEKIGGNESRFAEMMTLKAQQLGMQNTRYVNANGLPDNRQVSSARDIAILTRALLHDYPQYYGFFSQQNFTYRGKTMVNTNHLLGKMPGVDGVKTGFTNAAGFNLDASAVRNGHRLIAVVMGSSSGTVRNENVEGLLLTGFDIEDRRDRGEKILVTQALFERPAPGAPGYKLYRAEQTHEGDPIDVILAHNTSPRGASHANQAARDWWVQVGQFHSRQAAQVRIALVSRRFSKVFDDAEGQVGGRKRTYVARFTGMDQQAAREACSAVRSHGMSCIAGVRRV